MIELNTDELVPTAIRALADWHRADYTRCSRHGLARGGMNGVCRECNEIDDRAGACFRRVRELAEQLATDLV